MILARTDALPPRERALALSGGRGFAYLAGGDQTRARQLLKRGPAAVPAGGETGSAWAWPPLASVISWRPSGGPRWPLTCSSRPPRPAPGDGHRSAHRSRSASFYLLDVALASNFLGQIRGRDQGDHRHAAELVRRRAGARPTARPGTGSPSSSRSTTWPSAARPEAISTDAADLLKQGALALAAKAGDGPSLAYLPGGPGSRRRRQDRPDRGRVSLLSAAAALLEARGSGWLHAYVPRAPHGDSTLAALRAQMTGAAFEHASAYGRSLSGPGAVRHALEEQQAEPAPDAPAGSG